MISISMLMQLRKAPRFILVIMLFISVFLLAFLLMGCTSTAAAYQGTYLVEFQFNSSSSMYPLIEKAYMEKGSEELASMKVRANYLGICVDLEDSTTCGSKNDITLFKDFTGVSFFNSNSSTSLDLVQIASQYSHKVVKPYVLIATLVITLFMMLVLVYCTISFLPFVDYVRKFTLIISPANSLLWVVGCMWNHIATTSSQNLIEPSSMYIVTSSRGVKLLAMGWVSFGFILAVTLGCMTLCYRDHRRSLQDISDDEKSYSTGRGSI